MLRPFYLTILLLLGIHHLNAQQTDTLPDITFGPLLSYAMLTDGRNKTGHLVEAGFFVNQKMASRFHINMAAQLSYYTKNTTTPPTSEHILEDSLRQRAEGELTYESALLSIPIRGELYLGSKKKVALVVGAISRFRIYDKVSWNYEWVTRVSPGGTVISRSAPISEKPSLRIYQFQFLQLGFQYHLNNLRITPILNFDEEFFIKDATNVERIDNGVSYGLELSYRL
jgi:hypothetical protein